MSTPSSRLLTLLSLLQSRRDWPGSALAERLGVSARTVRRDVDRLRELGYPVRAHKGPDGGYRLDAGSQMPPLLLDDEQTVALAVALQTASTGVRGLDDAALRALTTLRQVMPSRLRAAAGALQVTAVPRGDPTRRPAVDAAALVAIAEAVRARAVLRFDHDAGSGDPAEAPTPRPPRRAEAHHLVTWGGRWYLVGYDLDRDDWRTYRVDRMTPRTPLGPRFAPRPLPARDVATFVTERFQHAPWPCRGEAVLAAPARDVAVWAGRDAVVEDLGEDRCRIVAGAWSWDGLAALLGMFGVPLWILGPEPLREAAQVLVARYTAALAPPP